MPPNAMSPRDRRNLQKLTHTMPDNLVHKKEQDVRFWRKGFDGVGDESSETYQWSDFGPKTVKIRFRVDQWHSSQMKLLKYLRATTRTHSTVMRALPFILPIVLYIFGGYDIHDVVLSQYNVPVSVQFLRHLLTIVVLSLPLASPKYGQNVNKVIGMLFALLSIHLSRRIVPDSMMINVPPLLLVFLSTAAMVAACFHLEVLAPYAFAGEKVRAYLTDDLDANNNPIWIEESGLTATMGQYWNPQSHRCSKKLLSEIYPRAGIPEMMSSSIDFAVYKNMSTKTLINLFKARFWPFDLGENWPAYVKSSDGTFFSLEAITLNPEQFRVRFEAGQHDEGVEGSDDEMIDMDYEERKALWKRRSELLEMEYKKRRRKNTSSDLDSDSEENNTREFSKSSSFHVSDDNLSRSKFKRLQELVSSEKDMFDGSDVWILPPCECKTLNYPTTFLKTPRKVWKSWNKKFTAQITGWWEFATSNWFTSTILLVLLLEVFGAISVYAGIQSQITERLLTYGEKYLQFMWRFGTEPLRHVYHYGPILKTPFGTFGFWNGLSKLEICAEKSGPNFNVDFWNKTDDLRNKCFEDYQTWEDQFVNFIVTVCILYVVYTKFISQKSETKAPSK
jgi:hypothetical protein